jgi:hypothetical protein
MNDVVLNEAQVTSSWRGALSTGATLPSALLIRPHRLRDVKYHRLRDVK